MNKLNSYIEASSPGWEQLIPSITLIPIIFISRIIADAKAKVHVICREEVDLSRADKVALIHCR